jgi:hypothetical protein
MPVLSFARWKGVPAAEWRWPNFTPQEIACRGTGSITINTEAMDRLQRLRDTLGVPLIVVSGYRSPAHNKAVGGAENSMHTRGQAFDISVANIDPAYLIREARAAGFTGIGTYPRQGFVHVDTGAVRTWGDPFPARETRFAPELAARPVMETAQGVATARGIVAAAASTLAAGASDLAEVAQHPVMAVAASLLPWLASAVAVVAVLAMVLALMRRKRAEGRDA